VNSSEREIIDFAKKVASGQIDNKKIEKIFRKIKRIRKCDVKKAMYTIKNIELSLYYVRFERTDYQAPSGEAILHLNKFIQSEGSVNYNILVSLFLTQIDIYHDDTGKQYYFFHKKTRRELVERLVDRFETLDEMDEKVAAKWKEEFNKLLKKDRRFRAYADYDN